MENSRTQMSWQNIKLFMLFWTLVIITSLIWNLYTQRQSIDASLHMQAAAIHSIEMEYRNWVIENGGVYVPVTDKIPPNPWLSHVPERDIRTPSGTLLTLLNSSYVVRLVHENMRTSGSPLRDHIASPRPINPVNAADAWERKALEAFARGDKESASFDVLADGKTYYRYMKPMVTEESCLKCHARFGDKLGDIRGGVSVSIPVDAVMLAGRDERNAMIAGHGLIWGLGLIGLLVGGRKQQQAMQAVEQGEETLHTNEERLQLATTAGHIGIWDWDVVNNELLWDESMYALYGIRKEDFGGAYDAWIRTLHPGDRETTDGEIQAALRGEREYAPEFRIIRPDGTVRNIKAASKTYYDTQGKPIRMVGTNIDITEQKRAEATRTQLAALVESSNDAVIGKTTDGIITTWNKAAEKIYGYTADEIIGKSVMVLAPPSGHAEIQAFLEKIRKGETVANHESERVRKDGTLIHVALTLSPIRDASGHVSGISTIARDVTEKRRMEEELREASVYNRSLIEASMDPLVTISVDGKITDVNQATEKVTGRGRTELIGTDFSNYFSAPEKAREGYRQVFARGYVTDYPLALRHRDGHLTEVLYNASVYRDETGKVLGVFAAARDVTERNKAEQEVRQLSQQNRLILDSAGEGIYGLDVEGCCTFVNPAAAQMLGFTVDELIGQSSHPLFHHTKPDGSPYPKEECPVHAAYKRGEIQRGSDLYWHKDGSSFPVEFISTPILETGTISGAVVTFRDITERKQAEEELRVSQLSLIEAQRIAHLGSWHVDLATNEVFWSEELYKMYGFDPALPPPLYTESMKLFTPESWERLSAAIAQAAGAGTPYELELEMVPKDGGRKWMLARGEQVCDESGAPVQVRGVVMDITARKLADEKLRRSEHGLSEAQRIAHLGNWELDLESNVLTWSDEIYRIFEIDPQKFGASYDAFLNAIHPDDRETVNKAYSDSVANKVPYDIVHRLQMPDGRIKYVNEKCETYYDKDGKPLRSVGTVHDITERKLDEEALQQLNRELRAISNCNETLMRAEDEQALLDDICRIVCDDAGYLMAWVGYPQNDEARSIRLISRAGADSGYLEQAQLTWADTERGHGPSGTAIRSGKSVSIQDFSTDPSAAPWRESALQRGYRSSIALPLKDENGKVFGILNIYAAMPDAFTPEEVRLLEELAGDMAFGIMVLHTRLERQRAEAEIKALNLELEQRVAARTADLEAANKELEAFSYSVSHDLRAPLRAIDGFSHILLDDYQDKLDDEGKRLLNVVRDNTNRMGQLIDDILKFSRAGRLEMTFSEIDMEALAREVYEELRQTADGHELQVEIEPIPAASGDRAMMRQVFVNLLSNALKFSRNKVPAKIKVGCAIEGGEAVYYVQDNGAGFDMQFADKLFGVFQRLHGATEFEGTGIGLAIVKRIVTRHGGRVWAEGKVNEGATMYFALPEKTEIDNS